VQTVALRLIVEREVQVREFVLQEYWSIHAMLEAGEPPPSKPSCSNTTARTLKFQSGNRRQNRCRRQ
jgi:DNA topoisomerase-1